MGCIWSANKRSLGICQPLISHIYIYMYNFYLRKIHLKMPPVKRGPIVKAWMYVSYVAIGATPYSRHIDFSLRSLFMIPVKPVAMWHMLTIIQNKLTTCHLSPISFTYNIGLDSQWYLTWTYKCHTIFASLQASPTIHLSPINLSICPLMYIAQGVYVSTQNPHTNNVQIHTYLSTFHSNRSSSVIFNTLRPSDAECVIKLTIVGLDNGLSPCSRAVTQPNIDHRSIDTLCNLVMLRYRSQQTTWTCRCLIFD